MSDLSDKIDAAVVSQTDLITEVDAAVGRVQTDVQKLNDTISAQTVEIANLEALVASGNFTQEDLDKLEQLKANNVTLTAKLKALDPTLVDVLPPE